MNDESQSNHNANEPSILESPEEHDIDETSRVPEKVEYYSSTILTFLIVAVIGFSIGAVGMMLILG